MKHNYLACSIKWLFDHSEDVRGFFTGLLVLEAVCAILAFTGWCDTHTTLTYGTCLLYTNILMICACLVLVLVYYLVCVINWTHKSVSPWINRKLQVLNAWADRNC